MRAGAFLPLDKAALPAAKLSNGIREVISRRLHLEFPTRLPRWRHGAISLRPTRLCYARHGADGSICG
jgi:hypothetical protein